MLMSDNEAAGWWPEERFQPLGSIELSSFSFSSVACPILGFALANFQLVGRGKINRILTQRVLERKIAQAIMDF